MTTNLKTRIANKGGIQLHHITGSENSTLTLTLSHVLKAWNNEAAGNGAVNIANVGLGNGFPKNDDLLDNVTADEINRVRITGPTKILTTFFNLILLKDEVKDIGTNAQNQLDFELTIDKDLGNQGDYWNITAMSGLNTNDRVMELSVVDFGVGLDTSKISISDTVYHTDPNNIIEIAEDRKGQKDALLHLEGLLKDLPTRHHVKYSENANENELTIQKGPDIDFSDPQPDLGQEAVLDPASPRAATGLWAYLIGRLYTGWNNHPRKAANIKHTLYNLADDLGTAIYHHEVLNWIRYLNEVEFFYSVVGLTKKSEAFIAQWNDYDELKLEPGLYKGFPVLDPNLRAVPDSGDNNKFKIEAIDPKQVVRYTKYNIDCLRNFADGYTGSNDKIFTEKTTIQDRNGNDIQVYQNRLPEELFGFQPGDIYEDKGRYWYTNGDWDFGGNSKIMLDILSAQSADEAMDLAFFGKDYDLVQSDFDAANRETNPRDAYWRKHPNLNLKFNEVKLWNRQKHLEKYYEVLKNDNVAWRNPGDSTGIGAADAEKYQDAHGNITATGKEIDKNYALAKEFITDYEDYLKVNVASLNKTKLEDIKNKLERYKNTRFYTSGGVWKLVIDNFLTEVSDALSLLNEDPDYDVPTWKTELAGLKNRASELAKKIYQNCQPDQDGFTENVFEELKKLIKLLEEAHGAKTTNTKRELEKFIADSVNNNSQKKALEIAKKVKNQDSDSENCIATALEKLKTLAEKQLEKARQKLKNLLAGLKTGGKDAYEEIISKIRSSETDINKVIQIWQKCQEIDMATNDDQGELLNTLNNLKNDASNKLAWEALNKYKRSNQSLGYPKEMLKKLNDWAEQRKKDYSDIKNAKNKTEFQAAKKEFIKKHEYLNNKQDYDEIYFPLAEKAAEIREKGTEISSEEKKLAELIVIVVSDYNDWKTQLVNLESKLNELKDYLKGGKKHKAVDKLSTIQQAALEKLVNKLEAKVQEWRAKKAKQENISSPENSLWWKTPMGVIGIVCVVAIIAGVIFYLVKQNARSKED